MSTSQTNSIYSVHEDDPLYTSLIGDFVRSIPAKQLEFLSVVETNDRKMLLTMAHKFKGSFATYGFGEVARLMEKIEFYLKDHSCVESFSSELTFKDLIYESVEIFAKIRSKN